MTVEIYDTTLRDGAQGEGISFSVEDKLRATKLLDELGIHYIEGGCPGSNPKDAEYFRRLQSVPLKNSTAVAFSYTGRVGVSPGDDPNLDALLAANTEVVTVVGKSWDLHVYKVLRTTLDENLRMIKETVRFLRSKGRRVFYDGEQFFDGFKANAAYALKTLEVAADGGAEVIVLCDTNGGSMPWEIERVICQVQKAINIRLGIHAHNDCEASVANTLVAVRCGVVQVQGTINGYGERVGNANLSSVIPNLKLKMGINCITDIQLGRLTEVSKIVSELANIPYNSHAPYVGRSAFAHKAGLHADATMKYRELYQHIDPERVRNGTRILVSEHSGKANVMFKAEELGIVHNVNKEEARRIAQRIKELESEGYSFENADASVYLLIRRELNRCDPLFETLHFTALYNHQSHQTMMTQAKIKLKAGNQVFHITAAGNDVLKVLGAELRKTLTPMYPILEEVHFYSCKIHILDGHGEKAGNTRVFIAFRRGSESWNTVGCSANIIEAIWQALVDGFEYFLLKELDAYA